MNVLYTLTSYPPATGGAQQHFHEIARRLNGPDNVQVVGQWRENRQDWLLGSTVFAPVPDNRPVDGIAVRGLDFTFADRALMAPAVPLFYGAPQVFTPWLSHFFLRKLRVMPFKPDLVHHGRIGRENLGFASLKRARELGVPFVLTPFHHPRWVGWRYQKYLELYREADHVFALTGAERDTLVNLGVTADRITVVGHGPSVVEGADGQVFRTQHGIGNAPLVLFLAQKYRYKGFLELLEAAPLIWKQVPEARIAFVGPRTKESEKAFSRVKDHRIIELDAVPLEEKCQALAACDVMVMPSIQESFGGVYVEAWMYSKPVVGGRIPAIASVIDEGVNGFLVEQDPGQIAARTIEILRDPAKARRFGEAGRAKAVANYTWDAITARVRDSYARAIESLKSKKA